MTTSTGEGTPTALGLLFGPNTDAAETLAREILSPGGDQSLAQALAHFPETTRKAAAQEAASSAAALLEVDPIEVLLRGWGQHRDIVSAARRTLATPGSTELVTMAGHEVTVEQKPSVRVLVNGNQVATLQLGLTIVFDVNALVLGISEGRLTAVHSGHCEVTVTLAVQGTDLAARHAHLELPGAVQLRRGFKLLPDSDYPAR
jgi:hypothetical protein